MDNKGCSHSRSDGVANRRLQRRADRFCYRSSAHRREGPVHYGVDMQPNRWGSPVELLLLPIVMLACIALLALVLHLVSPEHWNQPAGLESDERDAWYLASARSVAWFELECGVFSLLAALNPLSDDCKAMIVGAVAFELLLIATPLIFTARFRKSRGKGKARKL